MNVEDGYVDTSWMDTFEKLDAQYEHFYLDDILSIQIMCLYVDKNNDIETWKEQTFILREKNRLSKEELIGILKQYSFSQRKKYSLLSMFQYNVSLQPLDVSPFLNMNVIDTNTFVSIVKHLDDIVWSKTIQMFHDLNQLIIVFYDPASTNVHNLTKKIILSSLKQKKTKRSY